MKPDAVANVLIAGLAAYGVEARANTQLRPEGRWGLSLDFQPDGIDVEGTEGWPTVRVMWSGGTDDDATLGEALDHCVREAGRALRPTKGQRVVRDDDL